jgi:hypothetical protein
MAPRDGFRRAGDDHPPPGMAAVGAKVDDVIGCLDHVEMMLDSNDCMAGQTIQ